MMLAASSIFSFGAFVNPGSESMDGDRGSHRRQDNPKDHSLQLPKEGTTGVDAAGTRKQPPANPGRMSPNVSGKLPQPAVGRLSLYFRELHRLLDSDQHQINSADLGRLVNVSPAVVRRDLSALGTIGRRGVGYSIAALIDRIGMVLGSGVAWRVVLVGVGSLGDALLRYRGFERLGFEMIGAYDKDPSRVGREVGGVRVRPADAMVAELRQLKPDLAILAVPAEQAAAVAETLITAGVGGILNFAPTTLRLPGKVAVVNVDLASELQRLAFTVQSQCGHPPLPPTESIP